MKLELSLKQRTHLEKLATLRKGKVHTEETKKKIRLSALGHKRCLGRILSEETKKKIGFANKGKRKGVQFSIEHRTNMSNGKKKWWNNNPEQKLIYSERQKGDRGSNWQGGKTSATLADRRGVRYNLWRTSVFKRDNYTCQICGERGGNGKKVVLNADHIKLYSEFPELRYELSNGRTLCIECHKKTPTWGGLTRFKKKQYVQA